MYTVNDNSLQSIADSIRKKAKTTEKMTFPAGFVSAIEGIEAGGGSAPVVVEEPEEKDVNFYDYDGRRLFSYTAEEAAALTELPTPQVRDGIQFQEWNWTIDEVKKAKAADIGANCTTTDGKTRLYIKIDNSARKDMTLNLYQNTAGDISVDWGDGSASETSDTAGDISLPHTYESAGEYTITLSVKTGAKAGLGHFSSPYKQIFTGSGTNPDADTFSSNVHTNALIRAEIGNDIADIESEAFYGCENLESINIPTSIAHIKADAFLDCRKLQWISNKHMLSMYNFALTENGLQRAAFGGGGYAFGSSAAFQKDKNLKRAVLPTHYSMVLSSDYNGCTALVEVICNSNIKKIGSMAFFGCYSLKKLDLTKNTEIATLESYNAFQKTASDLEILVPAALADEWKAATNWTTYADNIKGV